MTGGTGLSEWVDSGSLAYRLVSVHINDPLAYNNPRLVFRITTLGRNHTSGGNNRFDNFTVEADTLSSLGLANTAIMPVYSLYPNPVNNVLSVNSNFDGGKTIIISDAVGQKIYEGRSEQASFEINTAGLNSGVYFITINELTTGSLYTARFIKQ